MTYPITRLAYNVKVNNLRRFPMLWGVMLMNQLRLAHSATLPLRSKLSIVPYKMCPITSIESYRTLKAQRNLARLIAEHPVAAAVVEHWMQCMVDELSLTETVNE